MPNQQNDEKRLVLEGYEFSDRAEYEDALKEKKAVEYLQQQVEIPV